MLGSMTSLASPVPSAPRGRHASPGALRLAVCYLTVVACLPYITLKMIWLAGGTVGVNDVGMMHSPATVFVNALTLGMDAVAILIVVAFTYGWGMRVPAWLVVVPIWVGTGFLVPLGLGVPLGTGLQLALGQGSPMSSASASELQPWVFMVVYSGFITQGVGLTVSFAGYARTRWPEVFALRARDAKASPADVMRRFLAWAATVPMAFAAVVDLYWAFGGDGGRAVHLNTAQQVFQGVNGAVLAGGAVGAVLLVQRKSGRLFRPLLATWLGAGAGFSNGLFAALSPMDKTITTLMHLDGEAGLLGGLVTGVVAASLVAERASEKAAEPMAGSAGQSARPTASSTP